MPVGDEMPPGGDADVVMVRPGAELRAAMEAAATAACRAAAGRRELEAATAHQADLFRRMAVAGRDAPSEMLPLTDAFRHAMQRQSAAERAARQTADLSAEADCLVAVLEYEMRAVPRGTA
jgi:hypothetical protein